MTGASSSASASASREGSSIMGSAKPFASVSGVAGVGVSSPFWPPLARPKLRISRALIPRLYSINDLSSRMGYSQELS